MFLVNTRKQHKKLTEIQLSCTWLRFKDTLVIKLCRTRSGRYSTSLTGLCPTEFRHCTETGIVLNIGIGTN